MAVTLGTISNYSSNTGYPWNYTSPATVNTSGAIALLLLVINGNGSKPTPTVTYQGTAMTLLGGVTTSNGKGWAYGLLSPAQTATGSFNVSVAANGDPAAYIAIPILEGAADPFGAIGSGAYAEGGTITDSLVTTGDNSVVIGGIMAVFGPAPAGWTHGGSSPTPTVLTTNATQSGAQAKIMRQDAGAEGSTVTLVNTIQYNNHGIFMVELLDGGGPAKQPLTVPSITNTTALGTPLAKDPNVEVLGPPSIENTSALGSPTVTRQVVVFYDTNPPAHTVTGNPGTVVERTSVAANYRVSRASVPVVNGEKKYWEITIDNIATDSIIAVGVGAENTPLEAQLGGWQSNAVSWDNTGGARQNNTGLNGKVDYAAGDVMMIAMDMANGWVFMGKNGVWYNGSTAGNVNFSSGDGKVNNTQWPTSTPIYPTVQTQNIGDKLSTNFGKRDFEYEPPAGFEAMDTGGPPAQDLSVPGLSAPFLLGSPEVQNLRQVIAPESLTFEAAVGTPSVGYIAYHEGIEAAPALGQPAVRHRMTVMGIDSTMLLGTPVVTVAVWNLEPEGINGAGGIGLGAHALSLNIKPLGIFENGALGDPAVRQIAQVSGILNEPVLGDPILLRGVWNILAGGIINESYLGNVEANYFIRIPSIINESDLGDHLVSPVYDDAGVYPLGIVNVARFGTAKINQRLYAQGLLADTTQFGSPALKGQNALNPEGIILTPAFGTAQINLRAYVGGIQNVSDLGIGKLVHLIQMNGEGLFTNSMLGVPSAFAGAWTLQPAGIINEILLGNPRLDYATNAAQSYIKVAGQWVAVEKTMVKHQGQWHELLSILEKVDGSWQRIY